MINKTKTAFQDYLNSIKDYKLLTKEQEYELAQKIKEGDEVAKQQFINSNLRLVINVAKNYVNSSNMSMEDLVAEGNLGLLVAVNRFNPDYGYRFSTCAVPWIKQAIVKGITDKSKTIRIPAHIYSLIMKMGKAVADLEADGFSNPSDKEIAVKMGITEAKVNELKAWKRQPISMDTTLGDESENTIEDVIADENAISPEEAAIKEDIKIRVCQALKKLPERTAKILKMRNGIWEEGDPIAWKKEHTLEQIGEELGITRERVRQIEKKAQNDLKLILKQA